MNVVLSVRVMVSSFITIFLVLVPRMLIYYGLNFSVINSIVTPWATFILLAFAGGFLVWPLLKNPKFAVFILVMVIATASALTFYLCDLALPW